VRFKPGDWVEIVNVPPEKAKYLGTAAQVVAVQGRGEDRRVIVRAATTLLMVLSAADLAPAKKSS
jgi:hypothetical protein